MRRDCCKNICQFRHGLQCGDIGFVGYPRGSGFLSDAITEFTTGRGEATSLAQHQFQVIEDGLVVEAGVGKFSSVVVRPWSSRVEECVNSKSHYIVFRPILFKSEKEAINREGLKLNGYRYGFLELILQAIDGGLRKVGLLQEGNPLFSRLGAIVPWTMICSGVGNHCLSAAGVLSSRFKYLAPDDTFDEAIRRSWRIVAMDPGGETYWKCAVRQQQEEGNC